MAKIKLKKKSKKRGKMDIHFSSKKHDWGTEQRLYDLLNREFKFGLDVCANKKNAKHKNFISKKEDAFVTNWKKRSGGKPCWMNPPYGRTVKKWVELALRKSQKSKLTVVCLVPARTDTKMIHDFAVHGEIRLMRGRVKFEGFNEDGTPCVDPAPFPSAIIVFGPKVKPKVVMWDWRSEL